SAWRSRFESRKDGSERTQRRSDPRMTKPKRVFERLPEGRQDRQAQCAPSTASQKRSPREKESWGSRSASPQFDIFAGCDRVNISQPPRRALNPKNFLEPSGVMQCLLGCSLLLAVLAPLAILASFLEAAICPADRRPSAARC